MAAPGGSAALKEVDGAGHKMLITGSDITPYGNQATQSVNYANLIN